MGHYARRAALAASCLMLVASAAPAAPTPARATRAGRWEIVLPHPPEVQRRIQERLARRGQRRDAQRTTVVYLNFEGVTLKGGADSFAPDNLTWLVGDPDAVLDYPAFDSAPFGVERQEAIATVVAHLQELFDGFDIRFVTERPADDEYMMTMIGGPSTIIGETEDVLGVSPLDCPPAIGTELSLNPNPHDISLAFSDGIGGSGMNLWDLTYIIAHENAHSYGLAHIDREVDIMYPSIAGGDRLSWGAGTAEPGGNCSPDGNQDDIEYLAEAIGGHNPRTESTPPAVAIAAPENAAAVEPSFEATATASDDSGIIRVEMFVNGERWSAATEEPYTFYFNGMDPGIYSLRARALDWFATPASSAVVNVIVPMPTAKACVSDADCDHVRRCQQGLCVDRPPSPQGGVLGAACAGDEDCLSGRCLEASFTYCSQVCREEAGAYCPIGFACKDGFCHSLTPVPPGGPGALCGQDAECQHGVCANAAANGFCTQPCTLGETACPGNAGCASLDDGQTFVCGRPPSDDGGCAAAPARPAPPGGLVGLLAMVAVAAARRRRWR